MTAQPIEADAAPAQWLKAALSPRKRIMALASGLVIADAIPAVGFAAGLGLAVGALPQGISHALPGAALAIGALLVRGVLAHCATVVGARAARAVKGDLRRQALNGAFAGRLSDAETMTATHEGVEALDGHVSRFLPARMAAAVTPLLLIAVAAVVSPFTAGIFLFTLAPFVIGMALTGMAAGAE
ncbi:MAG TPA: thiol reductant ABC exporter subunit CydD, partial [Brevundimonas sp.]|nr:thiol reductant ABC exporter subunit CydD [Brevundimonas sp.]